MNERFKLLAEQAGLHDFVLTAMGIDEEVTAFAELILKECTMALFDESERLSGLYSEEDNMRLAEEYEICSNQCINDIALIEKHFGVEE